MNLRKPDPHPTTLRRPGRWRVILLLGLFAIALLAGINEIATQEPRSESPVELDGVNESQRIFGGERQFGDRLGRGDADVSIQLFTDMQCADCREHFLQTVPELVESKVRTGEVQLLYRHYSFSRLPVQEGFLAAEAAAEQDYLWQYVYVFFASQGEAERLGVGPELLNAVAVAVSELDFPEWEADYERAKGEESSIRERLARWETIARDLGLRAEPSAVVSGPGGTEIVQDSPSLEEITAAVEAVS